MCLSIGNPGDISTNTWIWLLVMRVMTRMMLTTMILMTHLMMLKVMMMTMIDRYYDDGDDDQLEDLVDDSKDLLEEEECGFGCISRAIDHHLNHDDRDGDDDVGGHDDVVGGDN